MFDTYRVDKEQRVGKNVEHGLESVLDLLVTGDTGGVDVIDTRPNLVGVSVGLESVEEFHITLRGLNGDNISVETLDRGEDVIKVRVAEVRVGLELVSDASSRQLERVDGPLEVGIPV